VITNPAQLLVLPLLGLVALSLLAGALLLLRQSLRPTQVRWPPRIRGEEIAGASLRRSDGQADIEAARRRERASRRVVLPLVALIVLGVFFGRFAVAAFLHGGARPTPALADSVVSGTHAATLRVGERGPADATTLILTHGWGADRRDWQEVLAALPPDLHVVTWDLPGLGASSPGDHTPTSMSAMADELEAIVQAKGNGGPVILVGHSIGGMLNLEYARRYPERLGGVVKGLVQVDTTFTDPLLTKENAERSRRMQPIYEPLLRGVEATAPLCRGLGWLAWSSGLAHVELAMQSFAGRETWAQLDDMARYAWRSDPRVVAQGVIAMMHWDASDVLPRVSVPTLVLAGLQDRTTLPSASRRMAQDIPAAQLVEISPAAHLGPVESAGDYARPIADFSRRVGGPAARVALGQESRLP